MTMGAGGERAAGRGGAAGSRAPWGSSLGRRELVLGAVRLAACTAASCLLPASLAGCSLPGGPTRGVTDMGGREVRVPMEVDRVFCSNPIGTVDLYLLDPDCLVGWNFLPAGDNRRYIPERYLDLPPLGVWMGAGATPNPEEILRQGPQVILCHWTADDAGREMADAVADETGVPTLLVDYDIRSCAQMYRYVGGLLGREARAEELAAYCEDRLAYIRACADAVPESERKSIYLAQGMDGLTTDPVGSMHVTDALELIGVANVADMPGTAGRGMGMPTVNLEQVISWDPDAVLVSEFSMSNEEGADLYGRICADPDWQNVPCVRRGAVHRLPQSPFAWFGRPPSVVRLLGCLLVLRLLYPERTADLDLVGETREFYGLFHRVDLSEDEAREILSSVGGAA